METGLWASIAGPVVGGLISGLVGLGVAVYLRRREQLQRRLGLLRALESEVAVVAELLDVDLHIENLQGPVPTLEKLSRVEAARHVFEGSAGSLGILPGSLPRQIVRFYGRVEQRAPTLIQSIKNWGAPPRQEGQKQTYEEIRQELSLEAEVLLRDLREYL